MHLALESPADWLVVSIKFVYHDQVSDLHHSLFGTLEAVTATGRHNVDHEIDNMIDFNLRLADTYCLDNHSIKACMFTQKLDFSRV